MHQPLLLLAGAILAQTINTFAQFVNQDAHARNLTVVRSPGDENVTVSYKIPEGVCTTAFESQVQYTGWVSIPGDYPTNLFFWFVEAREPTTTLTIWLNGGPGSSSMYGFFTGNGPCEVIEKGLNEYDTAAREWGWDRASNMLYIDQPNQVGFSYDVPRNGTHDVLNATVEEPPLRDEAAYPWATINGTFSSTNRNQTVNTTELAAMAVWHALQGVLTSLPQYEPSRNEVMEINLFAESYGGRYGPIFAETIEQQNQKRLDGSLNRNSTLELRLNSLGIVNGCVDHEIQVPLNPVFATNNTYNFKAISNAEAAYVLARYSADGGCQDLLEQCKASVASRDPDGEGDDEATNDVCSEAQKACNQISLPYYAAGRSPYDLAAPYTDPVPAQHFVEYLNQADVQRVIGSPVNYTLSNSAVFYEFAETGDIARGGNIPRLAALLQRGVRVGLMYGDRDYICHWFGGEAVAERIAYEAGEDYGANFIGAGYAPIAVNDSYVGGVVRQYGNLSFSRIYQAGHAIPSYQPETAFQVFARIITGGSISTGESVDLTVYNTTGSANATETAELPSMPDSTCYVRALRDTCDEDAQQLLADGGGVVINGILYSSSEAWPLYASITTGAAAASTGPSSTQTLTGMYTATTVPDDSDSAASPGTRKSRFQYLTLAIGLGLWIL
ncbi:Carboxypeptidase S1 [Paramyrothecium foliicola]|nr:Carboxypeptidase S1 [Paramyrothecium foliicola]